VATAEHIRVLVADYEETRQIETDPVRQALAVALVSFAEQIGATVVAEGVETELQLEALRRAGIRHAQGFLLGSPGPLPEAGSASISGGFVPMKNMAETRPALSVMDPTGGGR
jgi:EAL domain-containing protein (putative c-di-GMP-specific phosphodiesterase class I)